MVSSKDWRDKFTQHLAKTGNVSKSARLAGVPRRTVYDERDKNPDFAQAWEDALEEGADELEEEARKRALADSDTLLIFLLKGLKPDKYRENKRVELAGDKDAPLQIEIKPANYREALSALMPDDSDT